MLFANYCLNVQKITVVPEIVLIAFCVFIKYRIYKQLSERSGMGEEKIYRSEIFGEAYEALCSELEKILLTSYPVFNIDSVNLFKNELLSFWNFSVKLMHEYNYYKTDYYMKCFNDFFISVDELKDDFVNTPDRRTVYSGLIKQLQGFYENCLSNMASDFIPFVHIKIFGENILTGVRLMDAQHKSLFVFIDKFLSCMIKKSDRNDVQKVVGFLERYSHKHFTDEESFMETSRYPKIEEHKLQHKKFIDCVRDLETKLDTEDSESLMESIYTALAEWLMKHILSEDKKFTDHYKDYERTFLSPDKL